MAYIQRSAIVSSSDTGSYLEAVLTLNGTLTGNSILVGICQHGSNIRTFTSSDSVNGSHTSVVGYNPARGAHIFEKRVGAGGNLTITVRNSATGGQFDAVALEVAGLDSGSSPITDTYLDGVAAATHPVADPGLDTTTGAFFFSVSACNGSTGSRTVASGWDEGWMGNGSERFFQRWDAASAQTGVTGTWTQTGTNRIATSVVAAFPYTGASGGTPSRMWTSFL